MDWAGPEKGTVQYSENEIDFEVKTFRRYPSCWWCLYCRQIFRQQRWAGLQWGLCHYGRSKWTFLVRFDCDLKEEEKDVSWKTFKHYSVIRDVMLEPEKFGVTTKILQGK